MDKKLLTNLGIASAIKSFILFILFYTSGRIKIFGLNAVYTFLILIAVFFNFIIGCTIVKELKQSKSKIIWIEYFITSFLEILMLIISFSHLKFLSDIFSLFIIIITILSVQGVFLLFELPNKLSPMFLLIPLLLIFGTLIGNTSHIEIAFLLIIISTNFFNVLFDEEFQVFFTREEIKQNYLKNSKRYKFITNLFNISISIMKVIQILLQKYYRNYNTPLYLHSIINKFPLTSYTLIGIGYIENAILFLVLTLVISMLLFLLLRFVSSKFK